MATMGDTPDGHIDRVDDDDWWAKELREADEEWAEVQAEEQHNPGGFCDLCWAGDGDPRCQRCGHSVGWPGCVCAAGYLKGPCI